MRKKICKVRVGRNNIIKMNIPRFAGYPDVGIGGGYGVFTTDEFINFDLVIRELFRSKKVEFRGR